MNRGTQRLFLETGTSLQLILAHNNEGVADVGAPNDLQQYRKWELIVGGPVHWFPVSFEGSKAEMFAWGIESALRLDGTTATWKDGTFGNPDDPEWQAHRLLQASPIPGDYQRFLGANVSDRTFRITVAQTVPIIEFNVREPGVLITPAEEVDVKPVAEAIVSRIPEQLRACEVCLRSQGARH